MSRSSWTSQVEDIQRKANAARERMEGLRSVLLKRKDLLRSIVAERGLKFQAKRAQLQDHNLQVGTGGCSGGRRRIRAAASVHGVLTARLRMRPASLRI